MNVYRVLCEVRITKKTISAMSNQITPDGKCHFDKPWVGRCNKETKGAFCEDHRNLKCVTCGDVAYTQCSRGVMGGAYICGNSLCLKCRCNQH